MENQVRAMLKDLQPDYDFEDGVDFVANGYLDSFDVVTLVTDLESTFHVAISALDIVPENFSSIKAICSLVQRCPKVGC